ncbi:MAG: asparagine--tRNA ligase [Candidatus Omnitrophota bacterium]
METTIQTVLIENISKYEGQDIQIKGWLYNKRSSGKLHFLQLRDGTGIIQAVIFKNDVTPEVFELADKITQESSIIVTGTVKADARSPIGFELSAKDLKLVQMAESYPITPKEHGIDYLMDYRHLWLRSKRQHAIMKIRHEIIKSSRDYFDNNGFTLIDSPILTPSACEGTSTLFETEYFDTKAYLTQSGQLYNEASCMAFGKVYCFGPTFRAEKSKTRRHLNEFWMIEPEMAYCDLDENMRVQEEYLSYVVQSVLKNREKELAILERDLTFLKKVTPPFPRVSYDEAVEILKKEGVDFAWGGDLGGGDETIIAQKFDKPFFVHRYPVECKAFYMKEDPNNNKLALCADLLAPEGYGEIIGGGQREDNIEILEKKIELHQLPKEAYSWYLDLRKYGSVPHSGFGLGIERVVSWICGLEHIRETIPFPRTLNRIYP